MLYIVTVGIEHESNAFLVRTDQPIPEKELLERVKQQTKLLIEYGYLDDENDALGNETWFTIEDAEIIDL